MIPVVPPAPFMAKVRMFLHSRRCERCRAAFWAGMAMEYSTKVMTAVMSLRDGQKVPFYPKYCLAVANFSSRRRIKAMRELGIVPFEDMTDEQKSAAIREINEAGKAALATRQRSLH